MSGRRLPGPDFISHDGVKRAGREHASADAGPLRRDPPRPGDSSFRQVADRPFQEGPSLRQPGKLHPALSEQGEGVPERPGLPGVLDMAEGQIQVALEPAPRDAQQGALTAS